MTVTNIDSARPEIQSTHYYFTSEDEAQMFLAWAREDLDEHAGYDYVDHEVYERHADDDWVVRIDYINRTPKSPEAA